MSKFSLIPFLLFLFLFQGTYSQKIDMTLFQGIKPRNIGPSGPSGRVTAIASDPRNHDIMYIGTASGGLWKTINAATTFFPVFDDQPVASIGAIAVDPQRPDIVWAGTGEGNPRNSVTGGYGIYKSYDGGKTWKLLGLQETRHIHRIAIDPHNSDIVYVGAIGTPWGPSKERGLFRTTDGGATWQKILYNGETTGVADMVMDPGNPDKLFVCMWNHQRWPWFFNSGGAGSGLYLTVDGGKSFTQIKNGLPEETGRIGIAIAKSNTNYVYAYVESKTNAIYRSTDGGFNWELRATKNIGTRPFYFAEIYVDPSNENRLYTLFSGINMSEDGGLTFPTPVAENIHLDHHAWWIDPNNPSHMADGNDGGLAITYDKGKTWRHITNLPVGQFYHINVDNEFPYRVYGGMQDNGSWAGPAYAWYDGGLINEFWDFLEGGDGFDAMPVPGDPRYCYCQSQGGALQRHDLLTGKSVFIRPAPNKGEKLRFNWNAALAQDPFDSNTIYFGSQFLHKSINRGDGWTKISPDLTTNDPQKLNQLKSGGITTDATGAENHCTIITISPSSLMNGLIWVGTDDGNVQLTKDGGKSWTNVAIVQKGVPAKAWIPQITASLYDPAEAWVVLNNYRLGDYSAYLFHTNDYGKTWQRIIDDQDVWGYVLCFIQDPVEPRLLFAGTEYGLYVSFDKGVNWNKWISGYPTVSTYDMAIQKRDCDLVIGTFGRSAWIIDNIIPLRELAAKGSSILNEKVRVFDTPLAINAEKKNLPGYYWRGDAMFEGPNRPSGAEITFYTNSEKPVKAKFEIKDTAGVVIRTLEADSKKGFNRIVWKLDRDPAPYAGLINKGNSNWAEDEKKRIQRGSQMMVFPGTYKVFASVDTAVSEASVSVFTDPRLPQPDRKAVVENYRRAIEIWQKTDEINDLYQRFYDCGRTLNQVDDFCQKFMVLGDSLRKIHDPMRKRYNELERSLITSPDGLFSLINKSRVLTGSAGGLTAAEEKSVNDAYRALEEARKLLSEFLDNDWPEYRRRLSEKSVPLNILIK